MLRPPTDREELSRLEEAPAARPVRAAAKWRILIADRNTHFRETIRRVLAPFPQCQVVAEAATLEEASQRIAETAPDLVLLDLSLVSGQGLAPLGELARRHPGVRLVVMLSDYSDAYRTAVQALGQHLYVAKDQLEEHLPRVLDRARSDP